MKLFYYTGANFGDAMSPLIVEKLSGRKVQFAQFVHADLAAVGSILYRGDAFIGDWRNIGIEAAIKAVPHLIHARISKPIKIWGSGFLTEPSFERPFIKKRLEVHALRGKLTHRYLAKYGLVEKNAAIPYGDPGLLYADLFGVRKETQYELGVIPHVRDVEAGREIAESYAKKGMRVRLIDASLAPDLVVGEIAKCEKILSSSLHGLIVADSLGIPNRHLVLSTLGHTPENFYLKFSDYYSAFGEELPSEKEFSVRDAHRIEEVKRNLLESFKAAFGNS